MKSSFPVLEEDDTTTCTGKECVGTKLEVIMIYVVRNLASKNLTLELHRLNCQGGVLEITRPRARYRRGAYSMPG